MNRPDDIEWRDNEGVVLGCSWHHGDYIRVYQGWEGIELEDIGSMVNLRDYLSELILWKTRFCIHQLYLYDQSTGEKKCVDCKREITK